MTWLAALAEGIVKGLVAFWQALIQRKDTQDAVLNKEHLEDSQAALAAERKIYDALQDDRARRRVVDLDELRARIARGEAADHGGSATGGRADHQ